MTEAGTPLTIKRYAGKRLVTGTVLKQIIVELRRHG